LGNIGTGFEVAGLAVAVGVVVVGAGPGVAAGALAVAALGGGFSLAAGVSQTAGGIFQGVGGAGYSNFWNGAVTTGGSLLLSAAFSSAQTGISASARASNQFIAKSSPNHRRWRADFMMRLPAHFKV